MSDTVSRVRAPSRRATYDISVLAGLGAVLLFFIASGFISYLNTRTLSRNAQQVALTHEVITGLSNVMGAMKDAETGQRGYMLTGDDKYLRPYTVAIPRIETEFETLEKLTSANADQHERLKTLRPRVDAKMDELRETIDLRRTQGLQAALKVVETDRGKKEMDAVRSIVIVMQQEQQDIRTQRLSETNKAYRVAVISGILTGLCGVLLSLAVAHLLRRSMLARQRQEWLQTGQVGLSNALVGEQRIEKLGENILSFLAEYFDAHAGAIFAQQSGVFSRIATYGVPADNNIPTQFKAGDGLLGQVVKDARTVMINEVPDNYLTVGSALGKGNPRHLLITPGTADNAVNTVIELGFVHPVDPLSLELLKMAAESIGVAMRSATYRAELQNLLEETQRQTEELQAQSEELKVSNEELEEQSNALKESQVRLEQQQAEMEQTNAQLEEQTQLLEVQRDEVTRAKNSVQLKAEELEQASQYKSDFLANMSHELRTPLNSSLILAKLLADNSQGNLSEEQVKYAQTIQSSGNDLLALINDILDLSKIEAGHMEVRSESLPMKRLVADLTRVFEPFAEQKNLEFKIMLDPTCPDLIETDRQRLEQILKNLLSNAFKFTEKGSITMQVSAPQEGKISFAVRDTGIGINPQQQQSVFDAFRQADGTINRKYGGTGLGLSISRELARLLGGHIELTSEPGKGSVFTVLIPAIYSAQNVQQRDATILRAPEKTPEPQATTPHVAIRRIEDDRELLAGNRRVLLVVEDDESFARILYDLAHELEFQCLIASTAEEALVVARQYMPSAVVLDVGLPDNSGLSVLDRLKRDPRTRHIPVHVVSAGDYAQTAMSLGAVGYMVKPVKREELSDALKKLETKLSQRLRRVLIVEDDEVQRESVRKLLATRDVETVAVGTAAECLAMLKESTFDCMVLDLTLPDTSGYDLLETLSKEDSYSFPPVIVYTGRDLKAADEQKLRRYSKSIIIKGAKSPERLLDEVSLFLHQVVSEMAPDKQKMIEKARNRDAVLEGRRILIVEDDIRNVYALTSILEPHGVQVQIARNGREALELMEKTKSSAATAIDLVLMDVMMPEMDGLTATRALRKEREWKKLPIIMLTAKAMRDDQERCLEAGANDYMAKPLDVEKLLSLVRVWMPR